MHHGDVGYDTNDPELTAEQRAIVEFPSEWYNSSIGQPGLEKDDRRAKAGCLMLQVRSRSWTRKI